jgi:hypothetical protein
VAEGGGGMRGETSRASLVNGAVASGFLGALSGLFTAVIYSDFVQRGCNNISSAEWIYTANCTDAFNGWRFTGGITAICLMVFVWSVWRLQRG